MNNKNNKAEMKNIVIGVVIVLAIVLLIAVFYFGFSGKSEADQSGTSSPDIANAKEFNVVSPSESFSEDKCEPGKKLILSDRKFFIRTESFDILGKEEYEEEEFCLVINNKGNQYYISLDGNNMFEIKIENGQRTVTPLD